MFIRWAVIGSTGMIGKKAVTDGIMKANGCKLVAVQGLFEHETAPLGEKWGVPWFTSPEDMLDKVDCDAVYIGSPQNVHLEHCKLAAKRGKHVFCEKPLGLNGSEVREMVDVCKENRIRLGTGFNLRFNSIHQKARELITGGAIGKVVSARCQYGQNYPPDPKAFRQVLENAGGGSMVDMGNHAMDLVEFVTGKCFNGVMAVTHNVIYKYGVEDSCGALLEFKGGGFAYIDTYYCVPLGILRNDLEVNGSSGILYTVDSLRGMTTGGKLVVIAADNKKQEYEFDGVDMYRKEVEAFASAVLAEKEPPCGGLDGLHSQRLLDAIYKSAKTGMKVEVPYENI
ncbi:MAG: Gfo/Idh/MocA family oxidoreductase [Ruminiclostridium sp.]|nr:Gfo/Idh/MocA family oxidoreductase [Ruminiclostridium sp.]